MKEVTAEAGTDHEMSADVSACIAQVGTSDRDRAKVSSTIVDGRKKSKGALDEQHRCHAHSQRRSSISQGKPK
jgi:hypothetical protein